MLKSGRGFVFQLIFFFIRLCNFDPMDDSDVLTRGSGVKDKQTDKLIFS